MREVTSEWISKAEGDYRSAEVLLYQIEIPEIDIAGIGLIAACSCTLIAATGST